MAYPLYTSLCGQENLSQIAVLDIAGLLFGFSIYMGIFGTGGKRREDQCKETMYECIPHTGIYCKCAWNPGRTVQGGDLPDRQSLRRCISGGGRDPYHIRDSNHSDRCGIQHGTDKGTDPAMPEDNPDESSATDTYGNWSAVGSAFVDRR